jgi:hypothetical protein
MSWKLSPKRFDRSALRRRPSGSVRSGTRRCSRQQCPPRTRKDQTPDRRRSSFAASTASRIISTTDEPEPPFRKQANGCSLVALLAPAAGNSVLRFRLDWPASVSQVAPHFFAYSATYFHGERGQRLTGRTATAFKGTTIGVERRQHEGVPHRISLEISEASFIEEQL